jgi:hypothetical protein
MHLSFVTELTFVINAQCIHIKTDWISWLSSRVNTNSLLKNGNILKRILSSLNISHKITFSGKNPQENCKVIHGRVWQVFLLANVVTLSQPVCLVRFTGISVSPWTSVSSFLLCVQHVCFTGISVGPWTSSASSFHSWSSCSVCLDTLSLLLSISGSPSMLCVHRSPLSSLSVSYDSRFSLSPHYIKLSIIIFQHKMDHHSQWVTTSNYLTLSILCNSGYYQYF